MRPLKQPLIFSIARTCRWFTASATSPAEAQREAVALAEMIGGVIDSHTSL
jgi:hypothetical protein